VFVDRAAATNRRTSGSSLASPKETSDFNSRFARPNGLGFYEASLVPYLDLDQHDAVTGKIDGVETRLRPDQRPKVLYTNSSGEYWGGGRAAALVHTTLDGKEDVKLPDNVRAYLIAGTQHVPGGYLPSQGEGQQKPNGNEYSWALRALLVGLDRWVRENVEPPLSAHPRLADHTLVPVSQIKFPAIPGVHSPLTIHPGYRADLDGPQRAYVLPLLVTQVDDDGNELSGIRLPNVSVPLATYTGWSFRSPSIGQPDELLPLTGSFIPFPVTKQDREKTSDPRPSIEERYEGRDQYRSLVTDAAMKLVKQGYVLEADVPGVVERALANWEALTGGTFLAEK
jgi:Alpha/beta hydrolase domain